MKDTKQFLNTVWEKDDQRFMVRDIAMNDSDDVTLVMTDGLKTITVSSDQLDGYTEITDQVGMRPFEYFVNISVHNREELNRLFEMVTASCLELTHRGIVPFEELQRSTDGNVKTGNTRLKDAVGIWTRAFCNIEAESPTGKEEDSEPKVHISIGLQGVYFINELTRGQELIENKGDLDGVYFFDVRFKTPDDIKDDVGRVINGFDIDIVLLNREEMDDEVQELASDDNYALSADDVEK